MSGFFGGAPSTKASLGLDTTDTPQFAGIELSHASANTLTGSSGNLLVEGQTVYRVGGTDVALTDGGTGSSTADAALTALLFPSAFISPAASQRVMRPNGQPAGNFTMISGTAYFLYIGQTMRATVIKKVRGIMNTAASVSSVGEIGVFTTTAAPNNAGQSLVATAAFTATTDDLTSAGPLARGNASDFTTSHAAGLHLWLGFRAACGGTQPIMGGYAGDGLAGTVLTTAGAAAFDGSTGYTGAVPAIAVAGTAVAPWLQALLD